MSSHAGASHDAIFKKFLSHPETARDFLSIHLPSPLRALCDLGTLRPEPASFVEPELRAAHSDILYSLRTTRGDGYVYCLIEHQSTPDPLMAFRLMQYSLRAMRAHLDKGHKQLPLVIPVLFYHGQVSPYPYSTDWLDGFAASEPARDLYSSPFPLIDVTIIPDDKILTHRRMALLELVQKHIRQRDMMELLEQFTQLLSLHTITHEQLEAFLHYVLQAGNTANPGGFVEQLAYRLPDYKENMMTIAEQLEQIGLEKGLEKGRMEGRHSASLEIARALLLCGVDFETVLKTTGLSRNDLESTHP
ncbi:MAG: Rpn family recombination-promoting nuclease/putative transposase [Azoarcus sp.]|jgi:predicted transposase/invertase (TIGR01784 family)|nr:Rpn family recombination-promoting nuclease/putative transposase [Azoarcus sp.]